MYRGRSLRGPSSASKSRRMVVMGDSEYPADILYEQSATARERLTFVRGVAAIPPDLQSPAFPIFLSLLHKQPVHISGSSVAAIIDVAQAWQCPSAISELESQTIAAGGTSRILDFLCVAPSHFPGMAAHVAANLGLFMDDPGFAALPMSVLGDIIYGNRSPRPKTHGHEAAQRVFGELGPSDDVDVEALKRQHSELAREVEELKRKITQTEADTRQQTEQLQNIEIKTDDVRRTTADTKKKIGAVQTRISEETKAVRALKADLDTVRQATAKLKKQRADIDAQVERVRRNLRQ